MFAVVILGVGFIMVAAIFPVALQQTRSNSEEAKAAQVARNVFKTVASVTNIEDYKAADPNTASVTAFSYNASVPGAQLYNKVQSSLLDASDPRFAAVGYYSPVSGIEGTFQVTVVVLESANRSTFTPADLDGSNGSLLARSVTINRLTTAADGSTAAVISKTAGQYSALGPGTFLVVNQGLVSTLGKPYHIAAKISETDTEAIWALSPDTQIAADQLTDPTTALFTGRDMTHPNQARPDDPGAEFTGPVQDVAAYTTFIKPN